MDNVLLISHPGVDNIPERPLLCHLCSVSAKMLSTIKNQRIEPTLISKDKLCRLAEIIGIFHDIGKATTWFQNYIRGATKAGEYTNHSLTSSLIALFFSISEFKEEEEWAYMVFQIILRHHSDLSSFRYDLSANNNKFGVVKDQIENIYKNSAKSLENFFTNYKINLEDLCKIDYQHMFDFLENIDFLIDEISKKNDNESIEYFFVNNYLFSLLTNSDKMDAARLDDSYFSDNLNESPIDVFDYLQQCKKEDPIKFDSQLEINQLRDRFLLSIDENTDIKEQNHFYSITAPTGIGKTFGCMVFASKLQKTLNRTMRIIYTLPYTSIIDQNYIEFENVIKYNKKDKYRIKPNRYLLKHHYLSPKEICKRKDPENLSMKDYQDDILLFESWQASTIVTTYVQLIQSIIGYKNKFLKKFHNIVNSILILDEVQNIDPNYHNLIGKSFEVLAQIFNLYILQVTATQPAIIKSNKVIELSAPENFMNHTIFSRVDMKYCRYPRELAEFCDNFCNGFNEDNCLIVVNTRSHAREIYKKIKKYYGEDYKCFCLTTYLTPFHRVEKIRAIKNLLKSKKKVIVVSTQLIEAGVDLSFKVAYRDFGPLDSIIQTAGRCNRNGEYGIKGGKMSITNFNNTKIYSRALIELTEKIMKKEEYSSTEFHNLSKEYFNEISNSYNYVSKNAIKAIKEMNFDQDIEGQVPISDIKLIPDDIRTSLYILHTHDADQNMQNFIKLKKNIIIDKDDRLIIEIEKLKYMLKPFQISLYPKEIEKYKDIIEPKNEVAEDQYYLYKYISFENQKKYAYDEDIGFLEDPKITISSLEIY